MDMLKLLFVWWVFHSVQAKCTLSNDELKYYDRIEDMHSYNAVNDSIDLFVQNLSMERMMKTYSFCKCKEDCDVSKFCRTVLKKYYSTEYLHYKEAEEIGQWKTKALKTATVEQRKDAETSEVKQFSVYSTKFKLSWKEYRIR